MFTPLDATHQTTLLNAIANGSSSAMIAAIEGAGIVIENNSVSGWQVLGDATVASKAQTIIDTEADWLPYGKGNKLLALQAQYASIINAGRIYTVPNDPSGAHTYQIDELQTATRQSSIATINAVASMADRALRVGVAGTPWDTGQPPFYFYDSSNTGVSMTAQQAYDFASNCGTYVSSVKLNTLSLKNQINGASTFSALSAISLTSGWPSNP